MSVRTRKKTFAAYLMDTTIAHYYAETGYDLSMQGRMELLKLKGCSARASRHWTTVDAAAKDGNQRNVINESCSLGTFFKTGTR
jgi:hypothetical protein